MPPLRPILSGVARTETFWTSIKTIKFRLWDEANGKMISCELKNQLAAQELKAA